jgi:large subunit ribosomal protein L18
MSSTIYKVKFRRRREQKTDYKKRLASLKSKKLRMVFRKSNRYINVQLIEYKDGVDVTNVHVNSRDLEKFGWMGNASQASSYLTGYLFGKRALQKGYKEAIFDLGMNTPAHGGRAFSALKGALDAGLTVPHSEEA